MTEDRDSLPRLSDPDGDADVRNLLRGALREEPATVDVLAGVQKKLRERSGGKFYADEWSTAKQPPTLTFLVTSALMLAMIVIAYAVLAPLRGQAASVKTEPAPIDVLPTIHR
ncbi:MAG TPA: hypothetical protein VH062_10360 [Polyangiaceae bacterium]|jgi:hypothetical protein|nr:hypothetical protein [Polyangiaceae bacterium]